MTIHRYCDGVRRRDFLKVGALGSGLSLASYLRLSHAGQIHSARGRAGILIFLSGGPSHLDMFDMKPKAPEEIRGQFHPIATSVPDIQICQHLPELARVAHKYAILRGVNHTLADHRSGTKYMNTGNRPQPALKYPGYASVVSKELSGPADLPKAVAIPKPTHPAGFLGVAYSPLATGERPRLGKPFAVRGTALPDGLTIADFEQRQNLLGDLDRLFAGYERNSELLSGLDKFSQQAYTIIRSKRTRQAFDVSREPAEVAQAFGKHSFGQSCLLAVRLVEAGVRFVTVQFGGWDTHGNNFGKLKDRLLPPFDTGLAAMLAELDHRGLLASTAVMVTGEFGRTPKVNANGGRDHWSRSMFVLMAGAGIRGGQVIGASNEQGAAPAGDPITPDSVAATFYHSLGIDHRKEYRTNSGRPVKIVGKGEVIRELF